MNCNDELKKILESEKRWTPKAFERFGVQFDNLKMMIPLWGANVYRIYDFSIKDKRERVTSPKGTSATIFGNLKNDELILVEGEWDLFAVFEAGIENVVTGTNGATTFTRDMAELLNGKSISIIYDNDMAGENGTKKITEKLRNQGCKFRIIQLPNIVGKSGDVRDLLTTFDYTKNKLLELINSIQYSHSLEPDKKIPKIHNLSEVNSKEVEWLWKPRIPKGATTIVVGQPGVGKSFLMAFLAARVTNDKSLFNLDSSLFEQGPVLIFNMEDSLESTIKSRISETDANQKMIYVINEKVKFDQAGEKFIRDTILKYKPALVIFDPITSLLGADVNMNASNEVRELMEIPLLLARDYNTAVVCVMHTNKNDSATDLLNRVMGSIDFIGAVRSVLMVLKHPLNPSLKLLGHIKANLSAPANTLIYKIDGGKYVEFIEVDDRPLQQIIDDLELDKKSKFAKNEALQFLKELLEYGPEKIIDILSSANENGISKSTVKRALKEIAYRKKISIKGKNRGAGYWIWYLKEDESRYKNVDHHGLLEHWDEEDHTTEQPITQGDQEHQESVVLRLSHEQ
jgi:5S rRNA maturation endonuclease (ribonuclease M5)